MSKIDPNANQKSITKEQNGESFCSDVKMRNVFERVREVTVGDDGDDDFCRRKF